MAEDRHWSPERSELFKAYPGKKWQDKVYNMSDAQVYATLVSIRQRREKSRDNRDSGE